MNGLRSLLSEGGNFGEMDILNIIADADGIKESINKYGEIVSRTDILLSSILLLKMSERHKAECPSITTKPASIDQEIFESDLYNSTKEIQKNSDEISDRIIEVLDQQRQEIEEIRRELNSISSELNSLSSDLSSMSYDLSCIRDQLHC